MYEQARRSPHWRGQAAPCPWRLASQRPRARVSPAPPQPQPQGGARQAWTPAGARRSEPARGRLWRGRGVERVVTRDQGAGRTCGGALTVGFFAGGGRTGSRSLSSLNSSSGAPPLSASRKELFVDESSANAADGSFRFAFPDGSFAAVAVAAAGSSLAPSIASAFSSSSSLSLSASFSAAGAGGRGVSCSPAAPSEDARVVRRLRGALPERLPL